MAQVNGNGRKTQVLTYLSVILASLGMIIMASAAGYLIVRGQQQNEALCEIGQSNRNVIFNILTLSEQRALENATSPQQIDEIEQVYDEFFALVPPIECGKGGPVELEP